MPRNAVEPNPESNPGLSDRRRQANDIRNRTRSCRGFEPGLHHTHMRIQCRVPAHILTTMLGVVSVLNDHHVEELSEGVHYHVVDSISMSCALNFGVDMHSLVQVERIEDSIAMALGTIVKKMACICGLTLLQCTDTDLHDLVVERVGVLVLSSFEVLPDGLPHFVPHQCTNMAVNICRVILVELDTHIKIRPLRIGYARWECTLLTELGLLWTL